MKRHMLIIGLLGLLPVLSMFLVPNALASNATGPVVTESVKRIDAGLNQAKKLLDGQQADALQGQYRSIETQWGLIKYALSVRNLAGSPSAQEFENALKEFGSATTSRNQNAAKASLARMSTAFKKLKEELQKTVTVNTTRIVASTGGFVLLWVALVLAIVRLTDRPGIKQ